MLFANGILRAAKALVNGSGSSQNRKCHRTHCLPVNRISSATGLVDHRVSIGETGANATHQSAQVREMGIARNLTSNNLSIEKRGNS